MIKSIVIFSLFFLFSGLMNAQPKCKSGEQMFDFQSDGWKNVMKQAKAEQKIVFVQFMSDDCNDCEKIKQDIWTDAELANIYLKDFFLYLPKEGRETRDLIAKYKINSFPTTLFVNANGKVVHKYIGSMSNYTMRQMAHDVVANTNTLMYFDALYKKDAAAMLPEQVLAYAKVLLHAGGEYKPIAEKYFDMLDPNTLLESTNVEAIMLFTDDMNTNEFNFFARHINEIENNEFTEYELNSKVEDVIASSLLTVLMTDKSLNLVDTLESTLSYFEVGNPEKIISRVEMDYYDYVKPDNKKYFNALSRYMQMHLQNLSQEEVVEKAQRVLADCEDTQLLDDALMWVSDFRLRPTKINDDLDIVYIELLVKVGREQEAADELNNMKSKWLEEEMDKDDATAKYNAYIKKYLKTQSDQPNQEEKIEIVR